MIIDESFSKTSVKIKVTPADDRDETMFKNV